MGLIGLVVTLMAMVVATASTAEVPPGSALLTRVHSHITEYRPLPLYLQLWTEWVEEQKMCQDKPKQKMWEKYVADARARRKIKKRVKSRI